MENILEHCELSNDTQNDLPVKKEEKFDSIVDMELPSSSEKYVDSDAIKKDSEDIEQTSPTTSSEKESPENEHKDLNISFDEDIILPSVRHDPEQEQKQRDRIKRKEMKSRKELEEEEREKMQ